MLIKCSVLVKKILKQQIIDSNTGSEKCSTHAEATISCVVCLCLCVCVCGGGGVVCVCV